MGMPSDPAKIEPAAEQERQAGAGDAPDVAVTSAPEEARRRRGPAAVAARDDHRRAGEAARGPAQGSQRYVHRPGHVALPPVLVVARVHEHRSAELEIVEQAVGSRGGLAPDVVPGRVVGGDPAGDDADDTPEPGAGEGSGDGT